jgi:hypothetical protein
METFTMNDRKDQRPSGWLGRAVLTAGLSALLAAPAVAVTTTTMEADGSARTIADEGTVSITPSIRSMPRTPVVPRSDVGSVIPIGPFVGDHLESFIPDFGGANITPCVEPRFHMFDDTADLCTSTGGGWAHITGGWGFMCSIGPKDTPWLFAVTEGHAVYTFDTPVGKFGGWFGSNAYPPGVIPTGTIEFYDPADLLISTLPITMTPSCTYAYNAWEVSGNTIKKIRVKNSVFGGAYLQMDDMAIGPAAPPVPEVPSDSTASVSVMAALMLGGLAFFSRKIA